MPTVSATTTAKPLLTTEDAIAARILRANTVPQAFFGWLAEPGTQRECPRDYADAAVRTSINQILVPLLDSASTLEKKQTYESSTWLAAICRYVIGTSRALDLGIGSRLLAASLLPLYRCLATGDLQEGFAQSRYRLSELLTLIAVCEEMGDDLVQLLEGCNQTNASPASVLKERFAVDLVRVAAIARRHAVEANGSQAVLSQATNRIDVGRDLTNAKQPIAEWATPDLLWRLAGEFLARKSELILPRSWADTPVPWASISDHWNVMTLLLAAPPTVDDDWQHNESGVQNAAQELACLASTDDTRLAAEMACDRNPNHDSGVTASASDLVPDTILGSESGRQDRHRSSVEKAVPAKVSTRPAANAQNRPAAGMQPTCPASPAPTLSKVMITEIHTDNDPVFVNVVRRQIATCRTEGRAVSLATIVVLPEGESDDRASRSNLENGLSWWQQKLVNWLAENPHVTNPHAFLTTAGELILCLLDLERNETTNLVRHGLVETLTGKRLDDPFSSLAKVNVPARYHAGIASISSPSQSFTPHDLIEAAARCLSAASRHGKASIKSIEVF